MANRAFGDPDLTPDNFNDFSAQEIDADSKAVGLAILEACPTARNTNAMDLATVIGSAAAGKLTTQITFHTVGDTGGIHNPEFQFAVADAMAADVAPSGAAFWYHLGDVVYYFGQEQYYFEQFYDPYRDYNAPIFAIPGNHDGALFQGETAGTLSAFLANFCDTTPNHSPDSQGAVRTTMDQPGVYFTLNAPLVKIIGLYSEYGGRQHGGRDLRGEGGQCAADVFSAAAGGGEGGARGRQLAGAGDCDASSAVYGEPGACAEPDDAAAD
jgi:hypothetical protein